MTENVQNSTFETTNNKWLDVWNEFKNHKGALAGAIIFLLTATIVFVNFITDVLLAIMDPRIRKGVMGGS